MAIKKKRNENLIGICHITFIGELGIATHEDLDQNSKECYLPLCEVLA